MHIRPTLQTDVSAIANIASNAFLDDELFVWIHPHMHTHRTSWDNYVLQRARARVHAPGSNAFVAVLDDRDAALGPAGTVVGYAFWERIGAPDSITAAAWRNTNTSLAHWLERQLLSVESWYAELFRLDRSVDRARARELDSSGAFDDSRFTAHAPEHWHLRVLAVHPDFQRRGVGALLGEWGLVNARREDVPVVLEASGKGNGLYRKLGFKTISWINVGPTIDAGGQVMVYDSTGKFVREAVGEERTVVVRGMEKEIDVVWKTAIAPVDIAIAEKSEADVDGLGSVGP